MEKRKNKNKRGRKRNLPVIEFRLGVEAQVHMHLMKKVRKIN